MHQTMSDRLAVVLWWYMELYSWSRFFLRTDGRADERTKVIQKVLADLKSMFDICLRYPRSFCHSVNHRTLYKHYLTTGRRGGLSCCYVARCNCYCYCYVVDKMIIMRLVMLLCCQVRLSVTGRRPPKLWDCHCLSICLCKEIDQQRIWLRKKWK